MTETRPVYHADLAALALLLLTALLAVAIVAAVVGAARRASDGRYDIRREE